MNLLFFQNGLDALALVGTEGDAGFSWADAFFHLFLLVFLLHFNLEVTYERKESQSVLALPTRGKAYCSYNHITPQQIDSDWDKISKLLHCSTREENTSTGTRDGMETSLALH